ncbi:MAG: hypothetical protein R2856_28005 [Caldilineaceae bacterium]
MWKPVTANESFEIVRRRLFSSDIDYAARDAVLSEFQKLYAQDSSSYPSGVAEGDYFNRMPPTPSTPNSSTVSIRIGRRWRSSSARGVLRLMAAVIHALWYHNDQSLLIMPGSVPLSVTTAMKCCAICPKTGRLSSIPTSTASTVALQHRQERTHVSSAAARRVAHHLRGQRAVGHWAGGARS